MDIPDIVHAIVARCTFPVMARLAQVNTWYRNIVYGHYRDAIKLADESCSGAHEPTAAHCTIAAGTSQRLRLRIYKRRQLLYHDVDIIGDDGSRVLFDIKDTINAPGLFNRVTTSLHVCANSNALVGQLTEICPPVFVGGVIHRICREVWTPVYIDVSVLPGAELVPQN